MRPLSDIIVNRFLEWLPKQDYPQRVGTHPNTAFGILRSLDHATWLAGQGESTFLELLTDSANRFFANDRDYPVHYEPSGADFLSAGLTEAELMSRVMPQPAYPGWLGEFLPGLATGERIFSPVAVSDPSDGHGSHLAGLNLSRAASMMAIAANLPDDDSRQESLRAMAAEHAGASLDSATGSHYMVEHWLAAYATLYLTA